MVNAEKIVIIPATKSVDFHYVVKTSSPAEYCLLATISVKFSSAKCQELVRIIADNLPIEVNPEFFREWSEAITHKQRVS